ncbi:hypothetical protein GGQ59_002136 [Parvularcula dongshanensis]|uniref:Uncharacterized protein n=1 Tax=Parvularcula dongshanensis TaxID=1173995 RepID=A0A840I400_9PROT|nr:hypothetical protein [Parvularcula dongshanensis]
MAFLANAGFHELPLPLVIRQSTFEFAAVMMGPGDASDIVLIADTVDARDADVVRRIQGVARALDLARSRNPLTCVLVGPRPHPDHLSRLMQVCRVLPVGTIPSGEEHSEEHLSNWLAVLTPLDQIDTEGAVADPMAELMSRIDDLTPDVQALCENVPNGPSAVEAAVNELLTKSLSAAWGDKA